MPMIACERGIGPSVSWVRKSGRVVHWLAFFLLLSSGEIPGQSPVLITLDFNNPTVEIPHRFSGVSFEMERVLSTGHGEYFFSDRNTRLIALFKILGIRSLRVGGNTADRPGIPVPSKADVDQLFAFARAADVKVIYTFRLRNGNVLEAADVASHITSHYDESLDCFAIGNEPNVFAEEYEEYLSEWWRYVRRIRSSSPESRFCGPSTTPGKAAWAKQFVADAGKSGFTKMITQHAYPGGSGMQVTNPREGIERMLSRDWVESYQKFHEAFVPAVDSAGLPFRLEETNNFFHAGAEGVSNTHAAALWGLDYALWWATHGAEGLNFHTGDSVAAGENTRPCQYAVFVTARDGYSVRPLGYALKALDIVAHGRIVPVHLDNVEDNYLTAYGTLSYTEELLVTVINKEVDPGRSRVPVSILAGPDFTSGEVMFLSVKNGDAHATSGTTLGGSEFTDDGVWNGTWSTVEKDDAGGQFVVKVPSASAVIVKLKPQ